MPKRKYHWETIKERVMRVFVEGMTPKVLRIAYNQDAEVRAANELIDMPVIYRVIEMMNMRMGLVFEERWKKGHAKMAALVNENRIEKE